MYFDINFKARNNEICCPLRGQNGVKNSPHHSRPYSPQVFINNRHFSRILQEGLWLGRTIHHRGKKEEEESVVESRRSNMTGSGSPCGACKFLRRKCTRGCIFAPYFCHEQGAAHFAAIHRVFGASNASKILANLPVSDRCEAAVAISYEAQARLQDPIYGCVSHIFALQQQVNIHNLWLTYGDRTTETLAIWFCFLHYFVYPSDWDGLCFDHVNGRSSICKLNWPLSRNKRLTGSLPLANDSRLSNSFLKSKVYRRSTLIRVCLNSVLVT